MDFRAEYEKWCTDPYFDEATKAELKAIAGDDKERYRQICMGERYRKVPMER